MAMGMKFRKMFCHIHADLLDGIDVQEVGDGGVEDAQDHQSDDDGAHIAEGRL